MACVVPRIVAVNAKIRSAVGIMSDRVEVHDGRTEMGMVVKLSNPISPAWDGANILLILHDGIVASVTCAGIPGAFESFVMKQFSVTLPVDPHGSAP